MTECRYRFSSYCVLLKGHDGDHSDTPFGYEVRSIEPPVDRDALGLNTPNPDEAPFYQAAEAVCSPLCGASKAYGRFDSPWKHEPECPIRLAAEAADREAAGMAGRVSGSAGPPTSAAVAPLVACPDCGHDVDHTTPCPDGCPMCPSAAVAPLEVCPSCGGEGRRADGSLCLGCQGFGSIEQAAEAADRETAEAAYQDSQNTDPQYREQRAYERGVVDEARRHPDQHPSAAVAHDPTICTGTDAVPCGCVCFDCNERGIHQAAEAADREADYQRFLYPKGKPAADPCPFDGWSEPHQTDDHRWPDDAVVAPLDVDPNPKIDPYALDVEALREQVYYLLFIYGQMDAEHGHWAAVRRMLNIDAAYADAIRKRGGA